MKKIAAGEAVRGFSSLLVDAQSEPVTIEKKGRPVAVLYSFEESQRIEEMRRKQFDAFIQKGIEDADNGSVQDATPQMIDDLVETGINLAKERK